MNALRVFFVCIVCLAAVCFVNEADAQYKWDGFFLGTLGVHTVDGTAFGGLTSMAVQKITPAWGLWDRMRWAERLFMAMICDFKL